MIYYEKDDVIVRDSKKQDMSHIIKHMRIGDINEIWASHNRLPQEALDIAFNKSFKCLTVLKGVISICMFGIYPDNFLGKSATIWLLATDELVDIQIKFLKESRNFIRMFQKDYPLLYNFVDARNTKSVRWLKFCGARMNGCVLYGVEKMPFHPFEFRRKL